MFLIFTFGLRITSGHLHTPLLRKNVRASRGTATLKFYKLEFSSRSVLRVACGEVELSYFGFAWQATLIINPFHLYGEVCPAELYVKWDSLLQSPCALCLYPPTRQ